MTSKTFNVGEEEGAGEKSMCCKICKFAGVLIAVAIAIVIGIYVFKKSFIGDFSGCNSPPKLDEKGLSNWTWNAKMVAFGCFPGYFIEEGQSEILVSRCMNQVWIPAPPACNFLPLRLNCKVEQHGLSGIVSMWQERTQDPAHISGVIHYEEAIKTEGHLLESIFLSRNNCTVTRDINSTEILESTNKNNTSNSTNKTSSDSSHSLHISFVSHQLKAYKKAELHINMVFLDINTSATIISVRQGNVSLVMPNPIPKVQINWSESETVDPSEII